MFTLREVLMQVKRKQIALDVAQGGNSYQCGCLINHTWIRMYWGGKQADIPVQTFNYSCERVILLHSYFCFFHELSGFEIVLFVINI